MMSKKLLGWENLFLILAVLPSCRGLQVSIPQTEYEAASGGDITMTCSFVPARPDFKAFVLQWEEFPDNPGAPMKSVATFFLNNPIDIAPAYEGRASLEVDTNNKVSTLHLTKLTMQDNRRFQCSVIIPNDDEGTLAASTSLLVLVAPSVPLCRIQGEAEYWQDITLTCVSEQGSPKPTYKWQSYSVENRPRQFPPKTTEKDGALSLFNISREMSGFFICTSTNRIDSAKCNLTLAVMPVSMNMGATAGIIGGVLAGLLILGIVIYCCCCKKKGKEDKYAEESPGEMEFLDRDNPETGGKYQDDKSNNVTKKNEEKDVPQNSHNVGTAGRTLEDHPHGYDSDKERHDGKGSEHKQSSQHDRYTGSRDRLDDQQDRYGGDSVGERDNYRGSRDRLDDKRERYGGSRDRLDDQRDRYSGSRDRLDDQRDRYGGSRDRLDDQRYRYGGSRDRLDDQRDRYGGSRDRLDDQRDRYGGSRDRLDDQRDRYGRRPDQSDHYGGTSERLRYIDDQ